MEKKDLSIGKKLIAILFFSCSLIFSGIFLAFSLKYLSWAIFKANEFMFEFIISMIITFAIGVIGYICLRVLLKYYKDNKKEKNSRWYLDKKLIAFMPILMTSATVLISFAFEEGETSCLIIGIIMYLFIGIITTPNVVKYALNDMKDWQKIFYQKGNLGSVDNSKDFYKIKFATNLERKIYFAVIKEQILNIQVVAICIILFLGITFFSMSVDSEGVKAGNISAAITYVKSERAEGPAFFISVFLISFWIPIFAYYITNAIYKLRIVHKREYIAYHAIVNSVNGNVIKISDKKRHYKYEYCTCVGIRQSKVNKTKATLIFIPDDVLLIPDKEQ